MVCFCFRLRAVFLGRFFLLFAITPPYSRKRPFRFPALILAEAFLTDKAKASGGRLLGYYFHKLLVRPLAAVDTAMPNILPRHLSERHSLTCPWLFPPAQRRLGGIIQGIRNPGSRLVDNPHGGSLGTFLALLLLPLDAGADA